MLTGFFITGVLIFYVRLVFFFPMIDGLIGFSLSYVGFSYDVDVMVVVFGLSQRLLCWQCLSVFVKLLFDMQLGSC